MDANSVQQHKNILEGHHITIERIQKNEHGIFDTEGTVNALVKIVDELLRTTSILLNEVKDG